MELVAYATFFPYTNSSRQPSLLLGREWVRQINLPSDSGNRKYYILGLYRNLIQAPDLGTTINTEIETTLEEVGSGEQIAPVDKVPTTAHEDESDTTSETIDNDEIWADAHSRQSLIQRE